MISLFEKDSYLSFSEIEEKNDRCLVDLSVILGSLQNHRSEDDFKKNLSYSLENGGEFYITSRSFEEFNEGIHFLKKEIKNSQGYQKRRSRHYVGDFDKRLLKTKRKINSEQKLLDLFYERKKILQLKGDLRKDYDLIYSNGFNVENEYKGDSTVFDFLISGLALSRKYKVSLLSNNFGMAKFLDSFLPEDFSNNYNINLFARVNEDNFERLV